MKSKTIFFEHAGTRPKGRSRALVPAYGPQKIVLDFTGLPDPYSPCENIILLGPFKAK